MRELFDEFVITVVVVFGLGALLFLIHGCGAAPSARQATLTALNTISTATNAAAPGVLAAMCLSELAAVHHNGRYEAGHCVRTDAPRGATEAESAELARVRAGWADVRRAYEAFAAAHDAARVITQTTDVQGAIEALGRLAAAYEALRQASAPHGLRLPALLGGA